MIYTYLKRKYDARQAAKNNPATEQDAAHRTDNSTQPQLDENNQSSAHMKKKLVWQVLLMAALAIPVFLETIDYTVVATAQVHIASIFNRLDLQSYIGTIYLLTSTVFLPPFASMADIFGRHWALQLSLVFFAVGSAISTGANNMPTMLAGRGVAGVGAAGLLSVVRIILTDSGSLNDNNWQQVLLFLLYTLGFCLGPFIGGKLLTVSFRWIFAINLPCCAVAIVLAFLLLRGRTKTGQPSRKLPTTDRQQETFMDKVFRIDWVGAALFMVGGILILLALNWGSLGDWKSAKVIVCFVVGGLAIIAFLLWERFLDGMEYTQSTSRWHLLYTEPMIPLELFRSLNICIIMYATAVSGIILLVMFYFVAIFFVIVSNLSPSQSGVQLIYFAPGMGGGSLLSIQLIRRLRQPKYPIVLGGIVSTVALGLISMGIEQEKQSLVNGFMAMAGVGTGLQVGPLAVQARFSQPAERNAVVSGLLLFFRSLGGTIGLAQCGAVLNGKVNSYIANLVHTGALSAADAESLSLSSAALSSVNGLNSLPPATQQFVRDAFREGSRYAFISLIPWCALAFLLTLLLKRIPDGDAGRMTEVGTKNEDAEKGHAKEVSTEAVDASPRV
ncbi:MFS general substrate transporter [Trametopsis cervina]|nr:MFS general substrate transporter [Trametopsis cervina]